VIYVTLGSDNAPQFELVDEYGSVPVAADDPNRTPEDDEDDSDGSDD